MALLTYPVLIEPVFRLKIQSWIWSICFFIFAVGCSVLMWFSAREEQAPAIEDPPRRAETSSKKAKKKKHSAKSQATESAPILTKKEILSESAPSNVFQKILWFVLPMVASILLLAVTNQLCTDVSSGPFLWILPLSIYLITFILTFSGWRFVYNRYVFFIALVAGTGAILRDMQYPHNNPLIVKIVLYCAVLFCGCIAAHGELYRLRPQHEQLTSFYLSISAGGAAGGIFVVVIAPLLFVDYFELHLAIIAIMALLIIALYHETRGKSIRTSTYVTLGISSIILLIIAGLLIYQANRSISNLSEIRRNFFGIVRVYEVNPNQPLMREYRLMHGNTEHGMQFVDPSRRQNPTLYFSSQSGIGVALNEYIRPPRMHVGIIGLGIGTIAAYAQPGDVYRFYDINPDIIALAQDTRYFTYIEQARQKGATVDIVPGDARLSMEHEAKTGQINQYDILALDAFSSDAIPAHLLTKEAFDIYFRLLKQNGILAVHVTNRNVDLAPVIFAAAEYYKYHSIFIMNNYIPQEEIYLSRWILLTNNPDFVKSRYTGHVPIPSEKRLKQPWTDDFYNLWRLMKERKLFK